MRPRALAWLLVATAGCRHDRPDDVPAAPDAAPPPPPAELSRFSAPLAYDFGSVLRIVDRAVPTTFGSLDSVRSLGGDDRRHYAFVAERSPFVAYAEGNLVHLRATVAYSARGYYKPPLAPTISGGCGGAKTDERPRLLIELATPLTLTADWHLKSATTIVTVEPASNTRRDRCDVTFLHRDVTDRVVGAARSAIATHLAEIDERVSGVDLRDRFASLWRLLARPIRLSDGVWLALNPQRLAIGAVTGSAHTLTIPVTLEARPEILTSAEEPTASATELPPLSRDGAGGGFNIRLDGVIDYANASSVIDAALLGRAFIAGGKRVRVTHVALAPAANGKLALTVSFVGDARGTVRFIGTPMLDSAKREITMPDLDYALATDNPLIAAYAWLRSDVMRAALRQKAHVPVDSALARGRTLLSSGLNRKIGDMTLAATVKSVAVKGVYVTRAGLVVRAEATGKASAVVRPR